MAGMGNRMQQHFT